MLKAMRNGSVDITSETSPEAVPLGPTAPALVQLQLISVQANAKFAMFHKLS